MNGKRITRWTFIMLQLPLLLSAQVVTRDMVIANGGAYSDPNDFATIATYDPSSGISETIATIFTQSIQGLLVHGNHAFLAAQDSLAKVDIETGEILQVVALSGVNKFAVFEDKLLVSRQFPAVSDFVQIRNIESLELIKSIPEISDESWEISVAGDTAYVSVAGGWAATEGKIARIDMNNLEFVSETNLGSDAIGIGPSYLYGNSMVFVCKSPWGATSGSIIYYDLITGQHEIQTYAHALGKGAGIYLNKLYLMMDGNIGVVDMNTQDVVNPALITDAFSNLDITACSLDTINANIYINYSYWIAPPGTGKIYDMDGNETGTYEVGVSAEEIAANYEDITLVDARIDKPATLVISPNPCHNQIHLDPGNPITEVLIMDLAGKVILKWNDVSNQRLTVDVSTLKPGLYLLVTNSGDQRLSRKFIKQ